MKKLLLILILISASVVSCEKEKFKIPEVTVKDINNYTETENNTCGEPLNHEGEYVRIDCYIQALNTFDNENRFHLFDSAFISGTRVEVRVVDNEKEIFEKINMILDYNNVENFSKFRITGKIIGVDIMFGDTPPGCKRFPFLEVNSEFNVFSIEG